MDRLKHPPTTMRGLRGVLRGGLDWIDVLLFIGTVAILYALVVSRAPILGTSKLIVGVAFAPVIARRMIFGVPDRGVMRTGALWSLVGIVGLFVLLVGAGATSVGVWGLGQIATRTEPDWARQGTPKGIVVFASVAGESPEQRAQQEQAAAQSELADDVRTRHAEWLRQQRSDRSTAWLVVVGGLALVLVGAGLDRLRFRRPAGVGVTPARPDVAA